MRDMRPVRRLSRRLPLLAALLLGGGAGASEPVLLVVEAARDTTAGFVALSLPDLGRRVLAWPEGVISVPDTAVWLESGRDGLAFALAAPPLAGVGAGGRFPAEPGRYKLDTPLVLQDGLVVACLSDGELEVAPGRFVYRRPGKRHDQRGDLLLLAGLVVATAVLLRAAGRRKRQA